MDERCDRCKFWQKRITSKSALGLETDVVEGACRRHPPVPVCVFNKIITSRPTVYSDQWCGEFEWMGEVEKKRALEEEE